MITTVYYALLSLAAVFLYFGYKHDISLRTVGFIIILLIGLNLAFNNLEYPSGVTETVAGNVTTAVTTYSTYTGLASLSVRTVGIFASIAAIVAFILSFFDIKSGGVNS